MDHRRFRNTPRRVIGLLGAGALALALHACGSDTDRQPPGERQHQAPRIRVVGQLTAPPGTRLPLEASASIRMVDLSEQPPLVLTEQLITPPGQFPIAFSVSYDSAAIDTTRRYGLQAVVRLDRKRLWQSEGVVPVLTLGHPDTVEVMMMESGR